MADVRREVVRTVEILFSGGRMVPLGTAARLLAVSPRTVKRFSDARGIRRESLPGRGRGAVDFPALAEAWRASGLEAEA